MAEPTYGRQVFEALVSLYGELAGDFYEVRDDGAWLLPAPLPDIPLFATNWTPACDLEGVDSPDPLSTPAIPLPFSAKWLAAWMLDGWGSAIRVTLGDWSQGPDKAQLDQLHLRARKVREAIDAAYRAVREAEIVVGHPDPVLQADVDRAFENFRAAESVGTKGPSCAEARAAYELAQRTAEQARVAWRQSMVRHLLAPSAARPVASVPKPRPLARAREDVILAELIRLGYEPQTLPVLKPGKTSESKQKVKEALGYSKDVMNKAWQALLDDGRMAYAKA